MSLKLSEGYHKLEHRFLGLTVREQVLLLLCGWGLIIGFMYLSLLEPLVQKNDKLGGDIKGFEARIQGSEASLARLLQSITQDPDEALRQRGDLLDGQIEALDKALQGQTVNLVPANKMPLLLESILADTQGLKLVELRSLSPTPMLQTEEKFSHPKLNLFRHGISLTLEGEFFTIQEYLQKIESLEWRFYWKKFDYTVSKYPLAKVELELYTLSTNKAFIGV